MSVERKELDASKYDLIREEPNQLNQLLEQLTSPLRKVISDVEGIMSRHPEITQGEIILTGQEGLNGTVTLKKSDEADGVTIRLTGNLAEKLSIIEGAIYLANWDGKFFYQPSPNLPPYIENKAVVQKGQPVGWAYENKNSQWRLDAEKDGQIIFISPNDSEVEANETILFSIRDY